MKDKKVLNKRRRNFDYKLDYINKKEVNYDTYETVKEYFTVIEGFILPAILFSDPFTG